MTKATNGLSGADAILQLAGAARQTVRHPASAQLNFVSGVQFANGPAAASRFICYHPPVPERASDFGTADLERLQNCLENQQPLLSFHSSRGFKNCLAFLRAEPPGFEARIPSVLHQCLAKLAASDKDVGLGRGWVLKDFVPHSIDAASDARPTAKAFTRFVNETDAFDLLLQ